MVGLGPLMPGIPLMPPIRIMPRLIAPILPTRIFLFCLFSFFFPNPFSLASCIKKKISSSRVVHLSLLLCLYFLYFALSVNLPYCIFQLAY